MKAVNAALLDVVVVVGGPVVVAPGASTGTSSYPSKV